jgi:hypothetical protein
LTCLEKTNEEVTRTEKALVAKIVKTVKDATTKATAQDKVVVKGKAIKNAKPQAAAKNGNGSQFENGKGPGDSPGPFAYW